MTTRDRFRTIGLIALGGAAAVVPQAAQAGGFYLQEQSVRAVGRAFTGEVADSGPQSLWWNPAAIGGMKGCEAAAGATVIIPRGKVTDTGTTIRRTLPAPFGVVTTPVGGQSEIEDPVVKGLLPSGSAACAVTDRIAFGVALSSPFSFTTEYPADGWTRYSADRSHLRTIDVQPTIAIMPADGLSIGVGLNIEQVNAELTNALPNLTPGSPDGRQALKGSGWDFGWSAGIRYASGPFEVGFAYKSSIEHKLDGKVTVSGLGGPLAVANGTRDAVATFRTPWQASVGVRAHVSDRLTLNGQVTHFGWSEFDAIRLGPPVNQAIEQNYDDTFAFGAGLDYRLTDRTTLRAGAMWDQSPVKDGNRDARVPDTDRVTIGVGGSHDLSERFTLEAGLGYTMFEDGPIDRTVRVYEGSLPVPITVNTNGRFTDGNAILLSVGARARF